MLIEVISFIPFITCLFWLVLNLLLNKNGKEFRTLGYLLSLLGIISFAQNVILYGENDLVLPCFFARQFFMLLLIPALLVMEIANWSSGSTFNSKFASNSFGTAYASVAPCRYIIFLSEIQDERIANKQKQ